MDKFVQRYKPYVGLIMLLIFNVSIPIHLYLLCYAIITFNVYLIAYFIITYFCGAYAKKNDSFIRFIQYFNTTSLFNHRELIVEESIPDKNCLFAFHPHGILAVGMLSSMNQIGTVFANTVLLGSRMALSVPLCGIVVKWWGVQSVSASNMKRLLKAGTNCAFLPGGFEEATITTKNENRIFLKDRKGFIKYALQNGTSIVPVFTFGENQLFNTVDKFIKLRLLMNKYKMIGTIFWSRFGIVPETDVSLITVVGKCVKCPQIEQPTTEEIDRYHEIYVNQLTSLYDKYQPKFAPNMKLRIY